MNNDMHQQEPFDIEIGNMVYSVFPEEKDTYTIFKDGQEYIQIVKDTETSWLKLNPETGLPMFGMDEEVNLLGAEIQKIVGI
ncbi:hypothetical protein [Parapedobacter sp. SGR-10]|uniref:hypothetical protein n=1 Tax=Parapedobacter sp. SGR-10 TaxID=2710879 RepID=UPI00293BC208|nr:hypothetical protein [Parapedobacter sp. SGR-10]